MARTRELRVALEHGATTRAVIYQAIGQQQRAATLVLAHGAGAGQDSPFMVTVAEGLTRLGIDTITFNFPYTERRRRLPDRRPILEACYRDVIEAVIRDGGSATNDIFIGGKSMGGRIATHVAAADASLAIAGIVLLGYPLHPPGRPEQRRDAHLSAVGRPMLFVQGSRDTFGTPGELEAALERLSPHPAMYVVDGGDHSFKVPRADTAQRTATSTEIQRAIATWLRAVSGQRSGQAERG